MSRHERFRYKTGDDLIRKAKELGFDIPWSDDLSPLLKPVTFEGFRIPNRFVVQPMEGYDSSAGGSPADLSFRRYLKYASGGSGIIWAEAIAVTGEGRSNPHQLWINDKNSKDFLRLTSSIKEEAGKRGGNPFLVAQITHSGRYSRPEGKSNPLVGAPNPVLDKHDPYILSDDDLKRIQDHFVSAARLAYESGFNAVDIKGCHGYLMIDLLSARDRMNSIYGGAGAGERFRYYLETIDRIKTEVPGIIVTTRLNISDCYTGGFGIDENNNPQFDEPLLLAEELLKRDIRLINITMGSPYHNPHVTRPFDTPVPGKKIPDEHPLEGVMRMISGTALFQKRFPEILVVGSAYSYLRQHAVNVGAAVLKNGDATFIGLGRSSFAYPDLPSDIMTKGKADPSKVCITCSGCTRLISNLRPGGCVIRDKAVYGNELKKLIADGK